MDKIINCKEYREVVEKNLSFEISKLNIKPTLVVLIVGEDPRSAVYVKNKEKACERVGIDSIVISLPLETTEDILLKQISVLNKDSAVHGILVQLPLPKHINESNILNAIDPKKDVDCFSPYNTGRLNLGTPTLTPCTAQGIVNLLKFNNIELQGKDVVVVGRSNIVGKPVAALMLNENATVTICHSKTENLAVKTSQADILIVAVGKEKYIKKEHLKDGVVVIDVGINRLENGKLCGDVDFDDVLDKVSLITPVPNGIGLITVTTLLENTLKAYFFK